MDWIYFSHNSHVGDLVTPALAQLDNIPEQLNWQSFYHQISDESTLCVSGEYILWMPLQA